ncbi:succinate--CoA ligase [GDP-forming] subunit beta, mitochondrial-like [Nilaparvata lugens]|uniref:succinate--CoA ligase [GDP-forming] subunit beta, mitochondrial-like n=1 Tax=Nilaparvata lugens TaxID=108931 RepID=UPI000B97D07C|nr:succinate--CoA ligase [GDP-forming] subunit beta, mitochondrial-like [Nilaparvata lugens]
MNRTLKNFLSMHNFLRICCPFPNLPIRQLSLLECDSKSLLQKHNVTVQKFEIIEKPDDLVKLKQTFKAQEYVIKAQILAGGRGLGVFDNNFKGGVHLTKDPEKLEGYVEKMLGHRLITKQTHEEGILVTKVMIAESVNIKRETYFCILLDRQYGGAVILASPDGGTAIEEVAEKSPELLKHFPVCIVEGLGDNAAKDIAKFLGFKGVFHDKAVNELKALWKFFVDFDVIQLEINPFAETDTNDVYSVDAKIQFDDNAEFRHEDIFKLAVTGEMDPREIEAMKYNLNYIGLEGNIGCLVNGAGLAMATMDIIQMHGGKPANFLDVGGGVTEDRVVRAFMILTSDHQVESILVNVFGGIVDCAVVAQGIVNASKTVKLKVPLVVRIEGTNVAAGRKVFEESGLAIQFASDLDQAAKLAVASLNVK